jgi:hypothetical protein
MQPDPIGDRIEHEYIREKQEPPSVAAGGS